MITFLLGGLWHGAGWTFIFWGFLHALALIIHRLWQKLNFKLNKILAWFITFNFVNIAWIFFRANEWQDATRILGGMVGLYGFGQISDLKHVNIPNIDLLFSFLVLFIALIILPLKNTNELKFDKPVMIFIAAFCFVFAIIGLDRVTEFLYFNF